MSELLRIRNVLIVAGCYADAEAAIPLAVQLARLAQAEITGVLAEDPAAHDLPGGAFLLAPRGTGAGAAFPASRMRAAFQADARAFEARLRRAAVQEALGWRFRREAGALPEVLARLATREDVALLGYRRTMRLRGPVVALGNSDAAGTGSGAAADPAFSLASALARAMNLPLMVIDPSGAPEHAGAHDLPPLPGRGAGPVPARLSVPDSAAALRALDRLAPTLVVLDSRLAGFHRGAELRALIETARCPILLISPRGDSLDTQPGRGAPAHPARG
ncbi:hypothetical protein [Alkalilacustris brevis]|uniref:hypothetical protein n=1 Tax=Alkalilacustris brevis TaxID=2026338 RepID=UPI000E0DF854|nr:hypothetical protein [Alkalilacustris brevis]